MPKRMNPKLRHKLMKTLAVRDGGLACLLCHSTEDLTVDHLDSNPKNNKLPNLHILCRGCNTAERNRRKKGERSLTTETAPTYRTLLTQRAGRTSQVTPVWVCEKDGGRGAEQRAKNKWALGTSEETNQVMEPLYRLWVFKTVTHRGSIDKAYALHAGAEHLHQCVGRGSSATTERYFKKMISETGCLVQVRGQQGGLEWVFRPDVDVRQLERVFKSEAGI